MALIPGYCPERTRGFTLLEVMVTLAVLGILVSIAIPSFSYLAANTKMKGAATDLHLALLKARSEAVKRSTSVTLTPTNSTNWAQGWSMTVDGVAVGEQSALQGVVITTATPLPTLVFQSSGRLQGGLSPRFNLTPLVRNTAEKVNVELVRCVSVQANGSPYVKEAACS